MRILGRQTNLIAVVATLIYTLFAIGMNYPGYPTKDPVLERQRIDAEHINETVTVYWNSGFPIHWHAVELLGDGRLQLYRHDNPLLVINIGLCVFGIAAVFIWLSETQVTILSMQCLIAICAVLFWADMRFQNLTYFYTYPMVFFLPSVLLVTKRLRGRISSKPTVECSA
jgi:hypothetical protein